MSTTTAITSGAPVISLAAMPNSTGSRAPVSGENAARTGERWV